MASTRAEQIRNVVEDRLHPRREFLVLVAREVSDVAAERHDRSRREQLVEAFFLDGLVQSACKREQRLTCSRWSRERDDLDVVIEQQFKRHRLLHIAPHHAIHRFARTSDWNRNARVSKHARQTRVVLITIINQHDELIRDRFDLDLVRIIRRARRELHESIDANLALVVELIDEFTRHTRNDIARVKEISRDMIVLEIFGGNAQRIALHSRIDVLRDEGRRKPRRMHLLRNGKNAIVCFA